jgi:hypothetical protein
MGGPAGSDLVVPIIVVCFIGITITHRNAELRRWKYEAIGSGTWGLGIDFLAGPQNHGAVFAWLFAPLVAGLLTLPLHHWLFGPTSKFLSLTRARGSYKVTHQFFGSRGSGLMMLALLFFGNSSIGILVTLLLFLVVLHARYYSGEALTRHPILYLRAFSENMVFRTFQTVVAPALSDRHVLIGLTPSKEKKQLIKGMFGLSVASLYVVPDAIWQRWVQNELARAYAVVFDLSVATDSLAWEIEQAAIACPPERILYLCGGQKSPTTSDRSTLINVTAEKGRIPSERSALRAWYASLA